jgi:TonB family protein
MKHLYFLLFFVVALFQAALAQSIPIDCDHKYQQWDDFLSDLVTFVESAPELIGGLEALQKEVNYPEISEQIEGRVFVRLIIDIEGNPYCMKVAKGLKEEFDQAAIEAVSKMKFKPATQRGEPIEMVYVLPVEFINPKDLQK